IREEVRVDLLTVASKEAVDEALPVAPVHERLPNLHVMEPRGWRIVEVGDVREWRKACGGLEPSLLQAPEIVERDVGDVEVTSRQLRAGDTLARGDLEDHVTEREGSTPVRIRLE